MSDSNPAKATWSAATELLREEGSLSDSQTAFVRMAQPLAAVDEIFMIAVGSEFVKNWIEEHVSEVMTEKVSAILGRTVRLMISVDPSINEMPTVQSADTESSGQKFSEQQYSQGSSRPAQTSSPSSSFDSQSRQYGDYPAADKTPRYENQFDSHRASDSHYGDREPSPEHQNSTFHPSDGEPSDSPSYRERHSFQDPASFQDPQDQVATRTFRSPYLSSDTTAITVEARLNPRYTFDNFVIGDSNRFATATSLAVAESPGTTYNPLFLYSDSGMGKTHLMHAIGNYALSLYSHSKIRYVSSEEFLNAFINSLGNGKMNEFKDQFRSVDILLIDDIQFIGGKEDTMVEFFHTFNALTNANKQIVITSDVAPNLLNGFEERMLSRFNSGVTASIDRPNLETRIAILEKKASADGIQVPREVHEYIATNMTTNIREMEGALRRVTAFADLSKQPVDLTLSEIVLKDLISNPDSIEITPSLIMGQTASYFQVSIDDLKSADRSRSLVTARQVAMYLCREMTSLSLPKIGDIFGGRDHTTVMHAYRKIDKQMAEKQTTYNQVSELTSRIKQAATHPA
ncbi:chromosomal replication initiator protein DnaA [Actinomycetaceae bacterium L2_0104]